MARTLKKTLKLSVSEIIRPQRLRVRLVPKSREGDSLTMSLTEITPQMGKRFAPDPGRASNALRSALHLGIDV